ncbi:MAG TPA: bifunctional UDP-N-acetylglucosamine diphosphorylase/glucosamine-1-phosphate N-acetyltransferase GlmU [Clostridia bacterium]|nr:bifunctional UDP-N-acetylglucosamine diphosphorylase/glucosamine-1-phosphate N-acetyltransferase GlmU [Clostridia bacterium]
MDRDCRMIVLAAGQGTRMKSGKAKVLHSIMGRPIIRIVMDVIKEAGFGRPIVVVGHQADAVKAAGGEEADFVLQEEQAGTGHAVRLASERLIDYEGIVGVLYGDTPLVEATLLLEMFNQHLRGGAACTIATTLIENPRGYGRVLRDESGRVLEVVEEKDASAEQRAVREVLGGLFFFDATLLKAALASLDTRNALGEYCLPHVIKWFSSQGMKVEAFRVYPPESIMGVNTRAELSHATDVIRRRLLQRWMEAGVSIVDVASTFVGFDVVLEADATIYPFTCIEGKSTICEGATIGPFAQVIDTFVGRRARVWHSVVEGSRIGDGATVGPFSHIRPGSDIQAGVRIGNFAEVKGSNIGPGTKINHHCYIGDADIGEGVNIGAGVVTVNYDGKTKYRTRIGDRAFVGCNVNLVAPVAVGEKAYVAAGSTITEDVPQEALGIARERQVNKEGWVTKKGIG